MTSSSIQSSVPSACPQKSSDMSNSWQPRGQLNSRGKHVLRKSVSSVIMRPVKTRKKKKKKEEEEEEERRLLLLGVPWGANDSRRSTASRSRVGTGVTVAVAPVMQRCRREQGSEA